eukprot:2525659-Rhodomonas_salina.1
MYTDKGWTVKPAPGIPTAGIRKGRRAAISITISISITTPSTNTCTTRLQSLYCVRFASGKATTKKHNKEHP